MNLRHIVFASPLFVLAVYGCVVGELGGEPNREASTNTTPGGEPCTDDPFKCKLGTTCWPALDGGAICIASKAYKTKGTECELLLERTSCADGLICITVSKPLDAGPDTGMADAPPKPTSQPLSLCAPWCDDKHPCPAGEDCRMLSFEGYPGRACVPSNLETPDTGPPDTGPPDTYKPDTYKPPTDTMMGMDMGMDTKVVDTAMPETPADTTPPPDTTADTAVADAVDAD